MEDGVNSGGFRLERSETEAALLLTAQGIEKRFGAMRALKGVDFALNRHEVHAIVGANGAGKSTLMRAIAGMHRIDSGSLTVDGREVRFFSPGDAIAAGVSMVTQETSLAPHLSVLENIFLPELAKPGRLNWSSNRQQAIALIDELQISVGFSLDDEVGRLSMANRQLVEILKVLALNSKVIFLDEPTTSLSPYECDKLLELTRKLAARGHSLVLVTHRMEEIFAATDRLTVLREGMTVVGGIKTDSIDANELIRLMVGRELSNIYAHHETRPIQATKKVLEVEGLSAGPMVKDVSFDIAAGEIVGLGGLVGAGRTETVEAIFGLRSVERGKISFSGEAFSPRSPLDSIRSGIGFIGEDRRTQGLIPDFSVRENLMLVQLSLQTQQLLGYKKYEAQAHEVVSRLGLNLSRLNDANILKFSGGMQQKIIIARWLLACPKLLILDEPTRGVDIETRSTIYKALRELADEGTAILVISSDFEELLGLSDRVVVLSDGRSVADVPVSCLDTQRLTMLSAPRRSAHLIGAMLARIAQQFNVNCMWLQHDDDYVFCLESAHSEQVAGMLKKGDFCPFADTVLSQSENAHTCVATVRGKQGQAMGAIVLLTSDPTKLPLSSELDSIIHHSIYTSESVAA
ncbi:heme ABC exporter, ATP-binding protein CcmA [Brucella pseudogrignonensis]|uniref:Heme ABC exporter, ATP-binding protein CcmA n=1 Tax=Brucella pseudogrignonensis TaxID=419475 RepID=A0A256G6V0_9HYPH|nr:heme ABC exporter, ATP-binding protein CcmA [Brucella pseudogrignonensis]